MAKPRIIPWKNMHEMPAHTVLWEEHKGDALTRKCEIIPINIKGFEDQIGVRYLDSKKELPLAQKECPNYRYWDIEPAEDQMEEALWEE